MNEHLVPGTRPAPQPVREVWQGEYEHQAVQTRFTELKEAYWPAIEAQITDAMAQHSPEGSTLPGMAAYHLSTGGKRLRAIMPLLVAEAFGVEPSAVVPFGAACEMLHNATLVHDDLQDGDEVRRGLPTVWTRYGMPQAVNTGDAMFYYTVLLAQRMGGTAEQREALVRLVMDDTLKVIDGQAREFQMMEQAEVSVQDYLTMVEGKTSGLFSLPMCGAALMCGAADEQVERIAEAARHLGVLFQIQDDVLDLYGDKGRGAVGNDIREGKRSFLVVHALQAACDEQTVWLRDILDLDRELTTDAMVQQVLDSLRVHGTLAAAIDELHHRRRLAVQAVAGDARLEALVGGLADLCMVPISEIIERQHRVATEDDHAFCAEILPQVSRTFALSIEMLPESLRDAVRVSYLLCRVVDTIEDDSSAPWDLREDMFRLFERLVSEESYQVEELQHRGGELGDSEQERALMARAGAVFRVYWSLSPAQREAVRPWILEMSQGMSEYAHKWLQAGSLQLTDVADLENYCWYVAGTVGELLTALFALEVGDADAAERLYEPAKRFGLALQFVNILKDVAEDAERGVCWLPQSLLTAHGLTKADLLDPSRREDGLKVIAILAERARGHLKVAGEYTACWPTDSGEQIRLFCAVPMALAFHTLAEVVEGSDTLVRGRTPKVTRELVGEVVGRALQAAGNDDVMEQWLAEMAAL